jgi:hypothetical protein
MRILMVLLLMVTGALAQDQAEAALIAAGCGSSSVQFDVKTDKTQHPVAQPEPGKAIVYVFRDEDIDNLGSIGPVETTRVGIDGTWAGSNGKKSYLFFAADPGSHRLCTERQSGTKSRLQEFAATSFIAEAGSVYYFRTQTSRHPTRTATVELVPIDPAEVQLLLPRFAHSTFEIKKEGKEGKVKHNWF